jgi:hypothetical protein
MSVAALVPLKPYFGLASGAQVGVFGATRRHQRGLTALCILDTGRDAMQIRTCAPILKQLTRLSAHNGEQILMHGYRSQCSSGRAMTKTPRLMVRRGALSLPCAYRRVNHPLS